MKKNINNKLQRDIVLKKKNRIVQNYEISIIKSIIIAVLIIMMDQLSKFYVTKYFQEFSHSIKIASFLNIVFTQNFGIAFGMLNNSTLNYLIPFFIACVTLIGLWIWVIISKEKNCHVPLGFITGGAIGNIIDRFHYGAVLDFIDFHYKNWHYPAFNVADSFICIGILMLITMPKLSLK